MSSSSSSCPGGSSGGSGCAATSLTSGAGAGATPSCELHHVLSPTPSSPTAVAVIRAARARWCELSGARAH
eukprot:scaffold135611_cov33-Tisochrysis_lutea.AAC.1